MDSPNILGRDRWNTSEVNKKARSALQDENTGSIADQYLQSLLNRVVMGAFTEAALMIAEAEDLELAKAQAETLMVALFSRLRGRLTVPFEN